MNEKPLIQKMRENYRYFGGLSLLYGVIFTFCLYDNPSGITFPVCVAVTVGFSVLYLKKIGYRLMKGSIPYIAGMLLLGISTALTMSGFLYVFNMLGIILLYFVFMIHQFYNDSNWEFPAYLKRIILLFGTMLGCIPFPYVHGAEHISGHKNTRNRGVAAVIIGICAAFGALCVILPLLLKSDMVFAKILGGLFRYVQFSTFFGILFTIFVGFTLSYAFFSALCKYNFPEDKARRMKYYSPVTGITFTGIISGIYLLYSAVQVVYLFAGVETGLPSGVTYSDYARSGFWELLVVAMLNFIMVLLCMYIFKENRVLKIILTIISGCTFVMIASAFYRMRLYIEAYHLTLLRILVMWFLAVLVFLMSGIILSIYKKKFPLFRYIVFIVSVMYIGLSFARPDALAARYNVKHAVSLTSADVYDMMYQGSLDVAPIVAEIDPDQIAYEYEEEKGVFKESLYSYFHAISQYQGENFSIRKANYSQIQAQKAADWYLAQ